MKFVLENLFKRFESKIKIKSEKTGEPWEKY